MCRKLRDTAEGCVLATRDGNFYVSLERIVDNMKQEELEAHLRERFGTSGKVTKGMLGTGIHRRLAEGPRLIRERQGTSGECQGVYLRRLKKASMRLTKVSRADFPDHASRREGLRNNSTPS